MMSMVRTVIMKRNFKIPLREQNGYYRELLGYYPVKDVDNAVAEIDEDDLA